jgi:FtsP/CotA-like multicopper oxidase with cupredoxin domain
VTIAPPDARVQIDGQPVEVVAGAIQIGGEPGQSFEVVVDARGTTQRARVMVTNEGKAMPDRVAVEAPAVAAAAASSAPVKGTPGRKPGAASGKGKPADTAAPAGDAPAPAPTATAATDPAKPSFKNAW